MREMVGWLCGMCTRRMLGHVNDESSILLCACLADL